MATQSLFNSWSTWWNYVKVALGAETAQASAWADQYNYLRAYYLGNGLYDVLRESFSQMGYSNETVKPLRNPAYRVIEFYSAKLWPGDLANGIPLLGNQRVIDAITQVHSMSNWATEKQAVARSFPMYGDLFLKVATKSENNRVSRVYMQNLEPQTVTDFDSDERSFLTYIRIDTPQTRRQPDGKVKAYTLTEVWDKPTQAFRRWEHDYGADTDIAQLGTPTEERSFGEFGIDFVPVVWQPFRHIGDSRGMAAITPAIDKIDEANRQATRLHQMLFRYNKPLWAASAGGNDASNRPLPPPRLGGSKGDTLILTNDPDQDDIVRLPGNATLTALVPTLDYASALTILQDQMAEIRQDLPEMVYSQLQERSDLSGIAIRYLLEAAIDRMVEARGNADAALVRAQEMALTIGSKAGIFSGLGTYEAGSFEHSIGPRPILSLAEFDRAQIFKTYIDAGLPATSAGRRAGWTAQEIEEMAKEKEEADAQAKAGIAAAMLNAQEQFQQGEGLPPGQQPGQEDEPTEEEEPEA
jgi:hypothetical protein